MNPAAEPLIMSAGVGFGGAEYDTDTGMLDKWGRPPNMSAELKTAKSTPRTQ